MKIMTISVSIIGIILLALIGGFNRALAHGETSSAEPAKVPVTYDAASRGTRNLVLGPVTIKMLIDASNLGRGDVEVGELQLPAGFGESAAHAHGSLEIFYVVDGVLGHEVNGKMHRLNPGEVGFVNPGDQIRHSVLSEEPVKAVVIWLPGGEADALIQHAGFKAEAIE